MDAKEKAFHLENHETSAAHHALMAKHCSTCAKAHQAMADASEVSDPDTSAGHQDMAKSFEKAAASHTSMGEHHVAACESLNGMPVHEGGTEKVEGEGAELLKGLRELLKTVVPTNVSAIPRTGNPTLVPRSGQRSATEVEKAIEPGLEVVLLDQNQR